MDYLSARKRVQDFINDRFGGDQDLIILDNQTAETSFGWVFCYDTRKFVETSELIYALAGNAPIIFDRRDSSLHIAGTAKGIDFYIREHLENYSPQPPK